MKQVIGIIMMYTGFSLSGLQAQTTASFNFSLGSQTVAGWNNVAGDPATAVRSVTDPTTKIGVSSVGPSNWAGYNGSSAFDGGGIPTAGFFPGPVMQNMWFQYSYYFSSYNPSVPQLIISGLSPGSFYTIKISCSFNVTLRNVFNLSPTRYSVAGLSVAGYIDVNGNANTTNGAIFNNVQPDNSGNIRVYINTLVSTSAAGISGIQIIPGKT
jgi:hypothetical protein